MLCKCGHDLAAHSGSGITGNLCKVCGVTDRGLVTGNCMGWSPPGSAAVEVDEHGQPVPDLTQAIHAAANALHLASAAGSFPVNNWQVDSQPVARVAVEAAWATLVDAHDHQAHLLRVELADLTRRLDQADRNTFEALEQVKWLREQVKWLREAAQAVWDSQNGYEITPQKIRQQEWTVVEVGRDAMADLGDVLDQAAQREDKGGLSMMRDYICPECRQPIEAGESTVIAYSTSYRVHTECGDDSDRAGVNPLEAHTAELRDLLEQLYEGFDAAADVGWLEQMAVKVYAVLQADGHARGHAILAEIERLRKFRDASLSSERLRLLADWLDLHDNKREYRGPRGVQDDLRRFANAVDALDQAAQREEDR